MAITADGMLVEAARAGDANAFGQLFDGWFDRVHDLSRRIVRDDGIAAEVAQDVFLSAWTKLGTLDDPDAFGGWLLRMARNRSLDRLRKEQRSLTVDDETMSAVTDAGAADVDPLADLDQAGRVALVWDAAAALGERDRSVLDLHLRHGLSAAELADELGTTPNNANQVMFTLRKRLGNAVRALVLWRAGHPTCADLRQGLAAAGLTSFGAPMVKAIDRHVEGCDVCDDDRTERLSPAALFAAAPIVAAPVLLKANAASALTEAGVPMAGSTAGSAAGTTGAGAPGASAASGSGAPGPAASAAAGAGTAAGTASGAVASDGGDGGMGGGGDADDQGAGHQDDDGHGGARRRAIAALAIAAAILIAMALVIILGGGKDGDDLLATAATSSTTTAVVTSTTEPRSDVSLAPAVTIDQTTDPTTVPVDPTVAASTTTPPTTSTTAAPAPPVIDGFRASVTDSPCGRDVAWILTWATTDADSVTIGRTDGKGQDAPTDGTTRLCAPYGTTFFLNADGPGGRASATAGGDDAPPPSQTTIVP